MPGVSHPVFWTGIAGYARYAFNNKYAVSERYEFTGTFDRIFARHFITRLEFRHDASSAPSFSKGTLPATAQNTLTGGLIYVFNLHKVG